MSRRLQQLPHARRWFALAGAGVLAIAGVVLAPAPRAVAGPPPPPRPPLPTQIVVKVDVAHGYSIANVTSSFPVTIEDGGLSSRGIYLLAPTQAPYTTDPKQLPALATKISHAKGVVYAQTNDPIQLADVHFHGWPYGAPTPIGDDPGAFTDQTAARQLQLDTAHKQSTGVGTIVAVLDTGVDASVPALSGKLLEGWNYVDDDADTSDAPQPGTTNASVGHGTFISGLVSLVAPDAKVLPEKVLNSDGIGTIYGAAQALSDATAAGARVINLSFGTSTRPHWNLLQDAIAQAQAAGVIVVAASGNDGDTAQHFPAAQPKVFSVGALDASSSSLTSFSDYGPWVQFAAPGTQIVGPMPGGGYALWAGTSMAAPFVSGQAALIVSTQPRITVDKATEAIAHTAIRLAHNPVKFGSIAIAASLTYVRSHH